MKRKAVMFLDLPGNRSASAHVNGAQFVSWFRTQGWKLTLLPPFSREWHWRIAGIKGFARIMTYGVMPIRRVFQILFRTSDADVVIVHKCLETMQQKPVLEVLLRKCHRHIIFNYDDAVYEKGIPYVPDRLRLANAVWVGNPVLADYSRQFCPRVALIESAVDCKRFAAKASYACHEPLRLIWSGQPFSQQYLELLREPLRRLAQRRRYILQIVSGREFSFHDPEICSEWVPYDPQAEVRLLQEADIALMPLTDGAYERGKENYKVKMYMACGLPVICSPVGINTHFIRAGERGFFARTPEEWVLAIERLADSQALREQMGRAAREHVVATYDIPVVGAQLLKLFEEVACAG